MKNTIFILALALLLPVFSFAQTAEKEALTFQEELNEQYKSRKESPLTKRDRRKFKGFDFYPVTEKYRVKATFERVENAVPFKMKTSTEREPVYEIYGIATFTINGQELKLNVYQSHRLRKMEEYKTHLFLPFTDATNGSGTYGGGRFIDLEIPEGDFIIIDFNKAYNPYCAYNGKYSCPIPPPENALAVPIEAGVRY